jgi:predicted transporter
MTSEFTVRDVLHEARPYVWIAGLAVLFGLAFLIAELLSPASSNVRQARSRIRPKACK